MASPYAEQAAAIIKANEAKKAVVPQAAQVSPVKSTSPYAAQAAAIIQANEPKSKPVAAPYVPLPNSVAEQYRQGKVPEQSGILDSIAKFLPSAVTSPINYLFPGSVTNDNSIATTLTRDLPHATKGALESSIGAVVQPISPVAQSPSIENVNDPVYKQNVLANNDAVNKPVTAQIKGLLGGASVPFMLPYQAASETTGFDPLTAINSATEILKFSENASDSDVVSAAKTLWNAGVDITTLLGIVKGAKGKRIVEEVASKPPEQPTGKTPNLNIIKAKKDIQDAIALREKAPASSEISANDAYFKGVKTKEDYTAYINNAQKYIDKTSTPITVKENQAGNITIQKGNEIVSPPKTIQNDIKAALAGETLLDARLPIFNDFLKKSDLQLVIDANGKPYIGNITKSESIQPPKIIEPKESTTEKLQSRVFERLKAEHPAELQGELYRDVINLKEDAARAVKMIETNKQRAFDIAMGRERSLDVTSTSVNIALAEKALADGNTKLYSDLIRNRSLEQTRRGQEIVSERGSISDNSTSRYVKELLAERLNKLGKKYLDNLKLKKTSPKENAMKAIDKEVSKIEAQIKNKKLDTKSALALLDKLTCL